MRRVIMLLVCLCLSGSGLLMSASAQTPEASPHLQDTIGGDAIPLLPKKEGDEVSVVAHGAADSSGMLPFVLRNDSDLVASDLLVKVEVKDSTGTLLGVGTTTGVGDIAPNVMNPGDVAIGFIFMEGSFPANAIYQFSVQPSGLGLAGFARDMEFISTSWNGSSVIGEIKNPGGTNLTMVTVIVMCFFQDGNPEAVTMDIVMEPIGPNATVTFQAGSLMYPTPQCDAFLIAGSGM